MPRKKHSAQEEKYYTVTKFDTVFSNRLSELIKTHKKEKKISTDQIAKDLEVTARIIQLWESKQSRPDIDRLITIANYFGVTVDYLVGKDENPNAPTLEVAHITEKFGLSSKAQKSLESAIWLRKERKQIESDMAYEFKNYVSQHGTFFQSWDIIKVINFLLEDGVPVEFERLYAGKCYHQKMLDCLASYLNCKINKVYEINIMGEIKEYTPYIGSDGEKYHKPNAVKMEPQIFKRAFLDELIRSIEEREKYLLEWEALNNGEEK